MRFKGCSWYLLLINQSLLAVLVLAVACISSKRGAQNMIQRDLLVEPKTISIAGMSVSAKVSPDRDGNRWNVTVVFSRAADLPPLDGRDVEAQLLDDKGSPLELLERPSGVLVEFGGSLGNSANAEFRFRRPDVIPAKLLVTYRASQGVFALRPASVPTGE